MEASPRRPNALARSLGKGREEEASLSQENHSIAGATNGVGYMMAVAQRLGKLQCPPLPFVSGLLLENHPRATRTVHSHLRTKE